MRCKTCDHTLWNQPAPREGEPRVCSECGAPYSAADFDFGRGKVRFCCPKCSTGYYGTSDKGHLEPAQFDCIGCGTHLTMDRCIIRAHDMAREHEAMQRRELPWLEEGSLGWVRRWWHTAKLSLSNAPQLVPLLSRPPKPMRAAVFLLVNSTIATAAYGGLSLVGLTFGSRMPLALAAVGLLELLVMLGALLASVLAIVLYAAIPAFLCSFLTRKGEPLGFGRAYEIAAYTSGSLLIAVIPCCGPVLGGIWWMAQIIQGFVSAFEGESWIKRFTAGILAFLGFASGVLVFAALALFV